MTQFHIIFIYIYMDINFNIQWEIVKKVKPFAPNDKVCKLCLQEKLSILRSAPSLNKRSEIFGHCIYIYI